MPLIAYNEEQLLYDPGVLSDTEKANFIIQEVSDMVFQTLQKLPSKAFELGTNVRSLVEGLLQGETTKEAA